MINKLDKYFVYNFSSRTNGKKYQFVEAFHVISNCTPKINAVYMEGYIYFDTVLGPCRILSDLLHDQINNTSLTSETFKYPPMVNYVCPANYGSSSHY